MKPPSLFSYGIAFALFLPLISFAQVGDIFGLTSWMYAVLVRLGELFWVLAVMLFMWGVVKFIVNANDTTAHAEGKRFIVWGIVAFVVLTSLWGIVNIVLFGTFDIVTGGQIQYRDKGDRIVN